MEVVNLFNGLDSNQVQECEASKKKLIEILAQYKDQWLVTGMMDYFLKTGSLRIIDVLVRVQSPHDTYIFDRLDDWITNNKVPANRIQGLNLFSFIVRKHPTWLFKVEKHRLFRNMIKLLQTEREIVPLMGALVCIITLLPIIPSLVPNFLSDLFELFAYLACWNCQNAKCLPEDKLVHLQLGLQMLFQCLYGMFPCNFMAYLSEFAKRERKESVVFQHTIKPLLESVRMHPMLVTANKESEVSHMRWKEMEPHDVVMECSKLALPLSHQDFINEQKQFLSTENYTPIITFNTTPNTTPYTTPNTTKNTTTASSNKFFHQIKDLYNQYGPVDRFTGSDNGTLWSPYNEIVATGQPPLTPTPSYMLPLTSPSSQLHNQLTVTGSSPPEAAVEATPETTPMKDIRDLKHNILATASSITKPNAVCAIFASSQPSSPMKREVNLFQYPTETVASELSKKLFRKQDIKFEELLKDRFDLRFSFLEETSDSKTTGRSAFEDLEKNFPQKVNKKITRQSNINHTTRVRRAKSCSSINTNQDASRNYVECNMTETGRCLQKSSKMLAIASATKKSKTSCLNSRIQHVDTGTQTIEVIPLQNYESNLFAILQETNKHSFAYESSRCHQHPQEILNRFIFSGSNKENVDAGRSLDNEKIQLLCYQLQYERYRREIHAERNRRLMGRSRDKRSLEMERDRLREQLKNFEEKNKECIQKRENTKLEMKKREFSYQEQLKTIQLKFQNEQERNKILQQENEDLQARLSKEFSSHKETNYEVEALRGQIFNLTSELQHAQEQMEIGLQCKQELARLEAEFIVMGEVQIKCRDRLAELDNYRARDVEMQMLQETYNAEIKDIKHKLDERTSHFDSARQKIHELQNQLINSEKAITEQKRLLKTVKDEYEEKLKSLNKKYDVQKTIIMQMKEKIIMSLQKPIPNTDKQQACSPDTDKTDVASSVDRNSPLSTSLPSSESLSASLRSTELRNLHQIVEPPGIGVVVEAAVLGVENTRVPFHDTATTTIHASTSSAMAAAAAAHASLAATSGTSTVTAAAVYEVIPVATAVTTLQTQHKTSQ